MQYFEMINCYVKHIWLISVCCFSLITSNHTFCCFLVLLSFSPSTCSPACSSPSFPVRHFPCPAFTGPAFSAPPPPSMMWTYTILQYCTEPNCHSSNLLLGYCNKVGNKTVAIAKKADRTAYNVRYSCMNRTANYTVYGNVEVTLTLFPAHARGIHYCRRFVFSVCFVLNDTYYSKSV